MGYDMARQRRNGRRIQPRDPEAGKALLHHMGHARAQFGHVLLWPYSAHGRVTVANI
jgi:hypothetical protein